MGFDYTIILDDIVSADNITLKSNIKTDAINNLLTTLSDVYVTILDNGLTALDAGSIQFKNKHTKKFFNIGILCLKNGKIPGTIKFLLDFLLLQTSGEKDISKEELFEMYFLTNIIPCLLPNGNCIKKFIDCLVEFCTEEVQHFQIVKFIKYIDTYKITGCYVLESTRAFINKKSSP
jgi:hypothetical protein